MIAADLTVHPLAVRHVPVHGRAVLVMCDAVQPAGECGELAEVSDGADLPGGVIGVLGCGRGAGGRGGVVRDGSRCAREAECEGAGEGERERERLPHRVVRMEHFLQ